MTLIDYDLQIKPHLNLIEAGAEMAARHARMMIARPDFPSIAQGELAAARKVLEQALGTIIAAEATYEAKPTESKAA